MEKSDPTGLTGTRAAATAALATDRSEKGVAGRLTPREGRKFGVSVGTAFLVLCGVLVWRGHSTGAVVLAGIGASLILAGLLIPAHLGPVQRAWMRLALAISRVTTPIIMGVIYYLVLTPAGILRRRLGANPIHHSPNDGSYWAPRPQDRRGSDLRRQF